MVESNKKRAAASFRIVQEELDKINQRAKDNAQVKDITP